MKRLRCWLASGAGVLGLSLSVVAYAVMAQEESARPVDPIETGVERKADEVLQSRSVGQPIGDRSGKAAENVLPPPLAPTVNAPGTEHAAEKPKGERELVAEAKAIASLYMQRVEPAEREAKKDELRRVLAMVVTMQEERRAAEIAAAEAKLARMKQIAASRKEAAQSIIERRVEVMTGGVDELAWEEPSEEVEGKKAVYENARPNAYQPPTAPQNRFSPGSFPYDPNSMPPKR
jgi:hypothetical protein